MDRINILVRHKELCFFMCHLLCLFNSPTFSQNLYNTAERFSIEDGLSNSHVTAIYQDSRGFIWIGTTDGLNRYDGYEFKVYRHNPIDSTSIVGNFIQTISETSDGNVWIGTRNSGLSIWNQHTGIFRNISKSSTGKLALPENGVYGILCQDKYAWVKTRHYVVGVNINTNMVELHNHYSSVFNSEKFNNYPIVISDNELWFGSKEGIHRMDLKSKAVMRVVTGTDFTNRDISGFVRISKTEFLVGTASGLLILNEKTLKTTPVLCKEKELMPLDVNCLYAQDSKKVWVGTSKGLYVSEYPFVNYERFNLGDLSDLYDVTSIMVDNSGILWIGTRQDGIIKRDQKQVKFRSITKENKLRYPIKSYDFESVYVDENNQLWLGTFNDGVYSINRSTGAFRNYLIENVGFQFKTPSVTAILKDVKGKMWFGTTDGVYLLDPTQGVLKEFDYANNDEFKTLLKSNEINDILQDKYDNIWFATQFGLYRYNGSGIVSFFYDSESDYGLCDDEVNVIYEDSEGWIWVGTNSGLSVYRPIDGFFMRVKNEMGQELKISHNIILSLAEDRNKRIVIGTQSGLSFYDKKTGMPGFWRNDDFLMNSKIYSVEVDFSNKIWISTGTGISSLRDDLSILHYNRKDGLPDYNFNIGSSYNYLKKELFFGGDKGLTIINTDSIKTNQFKPSVLITDLQVLVKGLEVEHYEKIIPSVVLRYRSNSIIRVAFAAMEFTQPKQNAFKVFLEGYDDEVRPVTTDNYVTFSNLPPGDYTLKVYGSNSDLVWGDEPVELKISIVPPLWMTSYAYVFYVIFGFFLIQMLINYRIRNYRRAYKALSEKSLDKKKIEAQKETLSKINKSLTDSISYAKRIQEAMIPSESMVKQICSDSFVYFRPKDIVSGDFYWIFEKGDKVFLAAVDCTGHGVPGAFMSIIGYDLIKNIVEIQGEECPELILNRLNQEVVDTFNRNNTSSQEDSVRDGMDMALIVIHKDKKLIEFAGAFNPLYLMRDNEIITFKGSRHPIGYIGERYNSSIFKKQQIPYFKNDILYLFSDGYADQFGGPEGKKFKYRRFRHLLLNIHKLPVDEQKSILHQKMEDWMGKDYPQVDDILLIGVKL